MRKIVETRNRVDGYDRTDGKIVRQEQYRSDSEKQLKI
jgi:hypothetical protein